MASRTQSSSFAGAQKGMGLAHGNWQTSRSKVTRVCAPRNFLAGILANPFDFRQAFHFSAAIDLIRTQLHVPLNHMRGSHATKVWAGKAGGGGCRSVLQDRSEEHTSELQSR